MFYTGKTYLEKETVQEVLQAANYFDIKSLVNFCLDYSRNMMDEVKPQRPKAQANRKSNNNNMLQSFSPITTTSFLPNIQIKPISSNSQINPVKLPNFNTVNPVFPIQTTMAQNVTQNLNQNLNQANSKLQPIQPTLNNSSNAQGPINPSDISSIVANLLGNITGNNSKPLNNNFLDSSLDISKLLGNNSNNTTVQPLKLNNNSLKSQANNSNLSNFTAKTENNSNFQSNVTDNPLINNTGLLTTSNPVKRTANGLKKDGTPRPAKVRRYACPTCQKAFSSFSDLQVHERVHTGVKPFACSVCHKAFSVKSNRRRHERTCHNLCDSPEPPGGKKRKSVKKENNANGNGNLINFSNLNSSMPLLQIPGLTGLTPTTTNNSISNLISSTFSPMVKNETKQNTSNNNGTDDAMQILLKTLTSNNDKPITPVKTEAQENQEMVNSLLGIQQTSTPVKSNPSNNISSSENNKSEEAMQILLNKITQPELKIEKPKTPESTTTTTQPDMVQMLLNNINKSSSDTSGVISESSQANLASCLSSLIQKNDK